jgi:hypothetical protein
MVEDEGIERLKHFLLKK